MRSFFSVIGLGLFALPSILAAPLPGVGDVADVVTHAVVVAKVLPKDMPSNRYQGASGGVDGLLGEVVALVNGLLGGVLSDGQLGSVVDPATGSYSVAPGSDEKVQNAINQLAALQHANSPLPADEWQDLNVKLFTLIKVFLFPYPDMDGSLPASGSPAPPEVSKLADDVVILITKIYVHLGALPGSVDYQHGVDDLKSRSHELLPLIVHLDLQAFIALWGL